MPSLTAQTASGLRWSYLGTAALAIADLAYIAIISRLLSPLAFGLMALASCLALALQSTPPTARRLHVPDDRRIERAKALLRRGDMSVTEVCMAVGCTSLGSFSSRFTELVGKAPSACRAWGHSALAAVPACAIRPSASRAGTGDGSGFKKRHGRTRP